MPMRSAALLFLAILSVHTAPQAADARPSNAAQDRAACAGVEDTKACLREAAAARAEARRGRLDEGAAADYQKNQLARCGYLRGEDRTLCERRMRGEGTVSGSVAGGGLYRELRTFE